MPRRRQGNTLLKDRREEILRSWNTLQSVMMELDEDELWQLLDHEVKHGKRRLMIERLHARYGKLRNERERSEYLRRVVG